jgi:hypothetical protein
MTKNNLTKIRATGESKISNNPQVPELQELMDVISEENKITERAGFEPPSFVTSYKISTYDASSFFSKL